VGGLNTSSLGASAPGKGGMMKELFLLLAVIGLVVATSDDHSGEVEWYLFQIKDWVCDNVSWIMYNIGR